MLPKIKQLSSSSSTSSCSYQLYTKRIRVILLIKAIIYYIVPSFSSKVQFYFLNTISGFRGRTTKKTCLIQIVGI